MNKKHTLRILMLSTGVAGLTLVYVFTTVEVGQFVVRQFSEVENLMTSVERVMTYTKLDSEPGYHITLSPHNKWSGDGSISFRDVSLRYYNGGPQVLKNLSFDIQGNKKVGIVGRTGAGKSSIVSGLLRMPEPDGDIIIDGVNIKNISLQESRQCVSVLGQTPVIFSGSIRDNLDPLGRHDDVALWAVLKTVGLKTLTENLNGKLQYELSQGGENLSIGERQLICLARTLLQQSKIVILDEPTAHVDPNTEQTIWNTVHEELKNSTIITIAHRLNTVRDSDIILALRDGEVAELGTFNDLLGRVGGILYNMAASQQTL